MIDPLSVLEDPPGEIRGLHWQRYASDGERLVAESVMDAVSAVRPELSPPFGPDLVVEVGLAEPVLGIEVNLWLLSRKNLANRVREALAATVMLRRGFAGEARLGLAAVLVAHPTYQWGVDSDDAFRRLAPLLRQHSGDAGFDCVVLGIKGAGGGWGELDSKGRFTALTDFSAAVRRLVRGDDAAHRRPIPAGQVSAGKPNRQGRPRIMLISDEWSSRTGGISTINRELAVAFAKAGCNVHVTVPEADPEERDSASESGVTLVTPDPLPGVKGKELLLTRPRTSDGYAPDAIVGHGRILGPYAHATKHLFFPRAKLLHIVHTDAERLELAKEKSGGPSRMETAYARQGLEVELAFAADLVAGIGPSLSDYIEDAMRGFHGEAPPVVEIRPGLRDWGGVVDSERPPRRRQVLLIARAEDFTSKGIDIAARAMAKAVDAFDGDGGDPPALVVRGVPEREADRIKDHLDSIVAPGMRVYLRPYSPDEEDLRRDLWQSRLVLMPSRHEGFGLVAYEAIAAGVPVLISEDSGLARMLSSLLPDGRHSRLSEILKVTGPDAMIVELWAQAIAERLADSHAAFRRAGEVRASLKDVVAWDRVANALLEGLGLGAAQAREPV